MYKRNTEARARSEFYCGKVVFIKISECWFVFLS